MGRVIRERRMGRLLRCRVSADSFLIPSGADASLFLSTRE